ncbi:2-hydroxy-palmitic acid dioxygenase MPO1 [Nymphaea colorata]|nr:2-hydroxy-palmitic acid dioxygenase MPO1 [Nymphaea colorata]XP_031499162.1 2-hydroxy-palmitic acid dioxygenase MPO1 [Nymphaea colorata]
MGLFDLEKHFAFYGAYHSNPINVIIHVLFVWPIFFTALLLFYFTPPMVNVTIPFPDTLYLNFGFFFALVFAGFYVLMDLKAGFLAAFLCFFCWVGSSFLGHRLGYSLAWKVVLASQIFCWTCQFIGHGVFERRAPALLDNLAQAFLMAPFFVLLEVLHKLFGYEPYPGFTSKVNAKIQADREVWQAKKLKKAS